MRLHAVGNALQFLLVLGVNVRPEHLACGLAEELPIALRLVRVEKLDRFERIGNFGGQQIPMLEPDVRGRTFQMNVGPAGLLEAIGFLQARIGRGRSCAVRWRSGNRLGKHSSENQKRDCQISQRRKGVDARHVGPHLILLIAIVAEVLH